MVAYGPHAPFHKMLRHDLAAVVYLQHISLEHHHYVKAGTDFAVKILFSITYIQINKKKRE